MASRWYDLSNKMANQQSQAELGSLAGKANAQLNTGLSGLGFRGNNNSGSMERLAASSAVGQGLGGQGAGLSRYNKLAELYGTGLGKIEIPTLIGQDQAAAQKNAQNDSNFIGNMFSNIF